MLTVEKSLRQFPISDVCRFAYAVEAIKVSIGELRVAAFSRGTTVILRTLDSIWVS